MVYFYKNFCIIGILGKWIMRIHSITNNQNFEGTVVLKNKISSQQNYLFNLHKPNLERMIKDMPFNLLVEQSKSKKTISLSTNVQGTFSYIVRKNEQNFEEAAGYAIEDAKKKSELYKKQLKANEMLEYVKAYMTHVIMGEFKDAREFQKDVARLAVKDFDLYKKVTNFRITELPPEVSRILLINSLRYKIYRAFTSKTPAEKELTRMNKQYLKDMKAQNKKIEPQIIKFNQYF